VVLIGLNLKVKHSLEFNMTRLRGTGTVHLGDILRLKGKNRHGKNRVRENGDLWEVINVDGTPDGVLSVKACIRPTEEGRTGEWRWIDLPDDEIMEWTVVASDWDNMNILDVEAPAV